MRVKTAGFKELQKALRAVDKDLPKEMRRGWNEVAEVVVDETRRRLPIQSGDLRSSVRAVSEQRSARVVMGSASVPYAGWVDFGGNRPHFRPFARHGRYLFPVVDDLRGAIDSRTNDMVNRLITKSGLD